jgi:tetratricopeptide (TPR) repeat protein
MDIIIIISLVIFLAGATLLLIISARHIPQMRVLNVETDIQLKSRRKKDEIILKKFSEGNGLIPKTGRAVVRVFSFLRRAGRRSIHRLRSLENYYDNLKRRKSASDSLTVDQVARALDEALQLAHEEKFAQAENKYIEIISLDPRAVKAYEYLGRLYTKTKQFDQAEQSLRFAAKLQPNDASVRASLGELYMMEENWNMAVEELEKAIAKRGTNAKYLDMYIEAALAAKLTDSVRNGIKKLKEANPENQKIEEFEKRLEEMSDM